jgi:hypothetical protein
MIFITMDYKKIYNNIIDNRKNNILEDNQYGEFHHIIPKSLGGSDEKENIVKLSAREHFICHLLLSEMYEKETYNWYKMNHAFHMMCSNNGLQFRYMNSRLYEFKRDDFRKTMSWSQSGEKNSQFGKKRNDDTKKKIRESLLKWNGNVSGITSRERKQIQKLKQKDLYTFNGVFFNKQRRDIVLKIFKIDLTENFNIKIIDVKNILVNLYHKEKKSTVEISKIFNCDDETIRNYLKVFEIPRRSMSESVKNSYK